MEWVGHQVPDETPVKNIVLVKLKIPSIFLWVACCFLALSPPVIAQELGKGLEQLVLCKENSQAKGAVERIKKGQGVKPDGEHFYKPTGKEKVFGYPLKYLGIGGVELVPGPSVVVKGNFQEVLGKIKKVTKKSFKPNEYWQEATGGKFLRILVFPDTKKRNRTYIQCGYFGP